MESGWSTDPSALTAELPLNSSTEFISKAKASLVPFQNLASGAFFGDSPTARSEQVRPQVFQTVSELTLPSSPTNVLSGEVRAPLLEDGAQQHHAPTRRAIQAAPAAAETERAAAKVRLTGDILGDFVIQFICYEFSQIIAKVQDCSVANSLASFTIYEQLEPSKDNERKKLQDKLNSKSREIQSLQQTLEHFKAEHKQVLVQLEEEHLKYEELNSRLLLQRDDCCKVILCDPLFFWHTCYCKRSVINILLYVLCCKMCVCVCACVHVYICL